MSLSPARQARLVRRLQSAYRSIIAWEASIRDTASAHFAEPHSAATLNVTATLGLLADTRGALNRRLAELGYRAPAGTLGARTRRRNRKPAAVVIPKTADSAVYLLCVSACRACGRALGLALRVAQAVADALSTRVLYPALRAFEKQLWVLRPHHA